MTASSPLKTGAALALTMAISYTVCAVAYALWPEQGIDFLNALFHGLDFRKLVTPVPFTLSTYLYLLLILAVWGFAVGTLFGWIFSRLNDRSSDK